MSTELVDRSAPALREWTRSWLAAELPTGWVQAVDAGDRATVAELRGQINYDDWCTRLGEAGLATPTWPSEYGAGMSLTPGEAKSVNDVLSQYQVPRSFNIIGIGMGGPTLIAWGTEEMKHRLLKPLACNQEIWCQLFSEPGAGSDVAGLATRAARDGDEWVVNGQKVWTTVAHISRWGMLLCRTNPDVPKHGGLSYFVVDMHQPGVEVRPLVQITGDAEFNEVFFNDAKVRHDWMLGREGDGWKVAITTLMNERVSLSGAGSIGGEAVGGSSFDRLLARTTDTSDPRVRQQLAQAYIESRLIRLNNERAAAKRKTGGEAGPEGSITKLMQAEFNKRLQNLAVGIAGMDGIAWEGAALSKTERVGRNPHVGEDALVAFGFLRAQANTIEGGTSDVMRNILGERVLGLPKEPDSSRELPWIDVPRSA